jgi:Zn-finger nucleic acid-binding protein
MEARYPCPVCLGTRMKKTVVPPGKSLVVDRCSICGGVWFDRGEVQEIRKIPLEIIKSHFELSREPHFMRCHSCFVSMDRNQAACHFCDRQNEICCPVCEGPMERVACKNLTLDVCRGCGGVWFDRDELVEIWNPDFWDDNPLALLNGADTRSRNNAWDLLDGFIYLPDMSGAGTGAAAQANIAAVPSSGDWISGVTEVAAEGAGQVALEAAAEAAGGAAEAAAEAIGGAAEGVAEAALEGVGEIAAEGIAEGVAEVALEAAGGLAEAAVEGVAEVAVEAVVGAAEGVAEAILEFIVEVIGSALG